MFRDTIHGVAGIVGFTKEDVPGGSSPCGLLILASGQRSCSCFQDGVVMTEPSWSRVTRINSWRSEAQQGKDLLGRPQFMHRSANIFFYLRVFGMNHDCGCTGCRLTFVRRPPSVCGAHTGKCLLCPSSAHFLGSPLLCAGLCSWPPSWGRAHQAHLFEASSAAKQKRCKVLRDGKRWASKPEDFAHV